MGFDQYHEPPDELSAEIRTFARMCANLTEEAEAIGWYEQRISVEPDANARAIMADSLAEEFKHFSMELEFLLRARPQWREIARGVLFQEGDIVRNGELSEQVAAADADDAGAPGDAVAPGDAASKKKADAGHPSLRIGSLRAET